jgi:CMP-N-acetylneuraminic acid synthetase
MKKRIAIIPARDGSKRLKNKNELIFNTKPLYEHSVLAALDSTLIDSYYVSTDSIFIQNDCKKKGYSFLVRPKNLSLDNTSTSEVMKHVIEELNLKSQDEILILQPTNPIRQKGFIDKFVSESENIHEWTSLSSITKLRKKIVRIDSEILNPVNYQLGQRSQDMADEIYFENGQVYITKVETILRYGNIFGDRPKGFICYEEHLESDIDTLEDFEIAQFKQASYHKKYNLI